MSEVWRSIPSAPGFMASDAGRIRSPLGRVLSQHDHRSGPATIYKRVALCIPRTAARQMGVAHQSKHLVHRLVCEAFHGPAPSPAHHAAHWNDVGTDNHPGNLRWATPAENVEDMRRNGVLHVGGRRVA